MNYIFTCRYIQTEIKIPFSEDLGPSELPFPQGWEKFWAGIHQGVNLLLCETASTEAVIGEKKQVEKSLILSSANFFRKLEWEIKHEQQCGLWILSRAIGIQYSDNHPTLIEVNPGSWPRKKLDSEEDWTMTNEGEGERVANILGLSSLEYPSCAFPPLSSQPFSQNSKQTQMKSSNHPHF